MSTVDTPLKKLAKVLTKDVNIFPNQTIMYQALVIFPSYIFDKNGINDYECQTIKARIRRMEQYVLKSSRTSVQSSDYEVLHKSICQILLNQGSDVEIISDDEQPRNYFSRYMDDSLKSSVSQILNGKRKASFQWLKAYQSCCKNRTRPDISVIVLRIFWMLQYFMVFYGRKQYLLVNAGFFADESVDFCEVYKMEWNMQKKLLNGLKREFGDSISNIQNINDKYFNFQILARVIFDVIYMHYQNFNHTKLERLNHDDIPLYEQSEKVRLKIENDQREFENYVKIYDATTIDRFHICESFSDTNCVAANELGNLYFSGAVLKAQELTTFQINPNYPQAYEYYVKSIQLSQGQYAPACWNAGVIISEYYDGFFPTKEMAQKKAMEYYRMAKNYPPAYNSMAKLMLKKYMTDYKDNKISMADMERGCGEALKLAYMAGEEGWLYGYNVIANFIIRNRKEMNWKETQENIWHHAEFTAQMDLFFFLKKAAKFQNLWAMYQMAVHYYEDRQQDKALEWLKKAGRLNFFPALCKMAVWFQQGEEQKQVLLGLSDKGFGMASYEWAMLNKDNKNVQLYYLQLARNQLCRMRVMDMDTFEKVVKAIEALEY